MTLQKSEAYEQNVQTRRLFGSFNTELQSIDKMIDEMLALAQGMRKAVANTTLYIAEIEHRYVEQSADKRKSDKLLHDATERLKDFVASAQLKSNVAIDIVKQRGKQIDALATQAHRIANERFVADNERDAPLPNLAYVGIDYFVAQLGVSAKMVREYITDARLPEHDAISNDGGRPSFLWLKSKAMVGIQHFHAELRNGDKIKKGVAAII